MASETKSADETDLSTIRKTLYCLRHAQSEYNAAVRNPKTWFTSDFWWNKFDPRIRDPMLSNLGKQQTNAVSQDVDSCDFVSSFGIQLIVTSPLQRAIDTMLNVLRNQMDVIQQNQINMKVHPDLREWVDTLGDYGTTKSDLVQKYNKLDFDSCIGREQWWTSDINGNGNGTEELVTKESREEVKDRIHAFKHWVLQQEEDKILVVGHSRWFKEFVGAWTKLHNCQMMKVEMTGTEVTKWEYVDFEKIKENRNKIKQMIDDI